LQRLDALRVGQRRVGAVANRLADPRRARRLADIRSHECDRAHQIGSVGCQHGGHPVAEGVSNDESRAIAFVRDDRRHVRRVVVQINSCKRPPALPDAARLRAQHAVAGAGKPFRDRLEVGRSAAERGKQNDDAASLLALRQHLDAHVMVRNDVSGRRLR